MPQNRREFLRNSFYTLAASAFAGVACNRVNPNSYARGPSQRKGRLLLVLGKRSEQDPSFALRFLDWDTYQYRDFPIDMVRPHAVVQNHKNKDEFFLFEMFGIRSKLNIVSGDHLKLKLKETSALSYGHGVQSNSGEHLFCTEIAPPFSPSVAVRSVENLEKIGTLPGEIGGHHIVQLPNTSILVCGASVGPKKMGLCFYDYAKNIVLKNIPMEFGLTHLTPISSSEIIGVGTRASLGHHGSSGLSFSGAKVSKNEMTFNDTLQTEPAPMFYANLDGGFRTFWDEKQKNLFDHGFGAAYVPSRGLIISSFAESSDSVILWKDYKMIKTFSVPGASSVVVSKDAKEFMVLGKGVLSVFSLETLTKIKEIRDDFNIIALNSYS